MSPDIEQHITSREERLRVAMIASDLAALDELISSDLVFTNHLGQVFNKHDDLALHRSGILKFHAIAPSEMRVKASGQVAVVSVRMALAGAYDSAAFTADLRYTRVWRLSDRGAWHLVAGHSSAVAQETT